MSDKMYFLYKELLGFEFNGPVYTITVMLSRSVYHPFPGTVQSSKQLTSTCAHLLPETDNCPSWTVYKQTFSWQMSLRGCLQQSLILSIIRAPPITLEIVSLHSDQFSTCPLPACQAKTSPVVNFFPFFLLPAPSLGPFNCVLQNSPEECELCMQLAYKIHILI